MHLLITSAVVGVVIAVATLTREKHRRIGLIINRLAGLGLVIAGVYLFYTAPSAVVVTHATTAGSEAQLTYGRIQCGSQFDRFPMPYGGASVTGETHIVAVEQAQVCVPERSQRKFNALLLGMVGAVGLLVTAPRRRREPDLVSADIDEARWGVARV